MNVALTIALPLLALLLLAARADLRTRRIPNRLVALGLLLALATRLITGGVPGLLSALGGALLAGGLLFPGWLLGWMGAGDVKLMAVVGGWLGVTLGGMAVLFSFVGGGVIALVVALRHGALRRTFHGAAALGAWALSPGTGPAPVSNSGIRYPFAVAILAGTVAALWVRT